MATVAGEIRSIEGLSISQWSPIDTTQVGLTGRSTARPRIVQLARQLGGEINSLTFTEVRDVPLYDFEITIPLDSTRPEGVDYWRKQQLASDTSGESTGPRVADASHPEGVRDSNSGDDTSTVASPTLSKEETSSGADASSSASSAGTETAETGWTVVVASLANDGPAQEVARTYRDRVTGVDYSVHVRRSPENGRYRVGIGTFSSFEAARSAMQEMEGVLPDDVWLNRYTLESGGTTAGSSGLARDGSGQ